MTPRRTFFKATALTIAGSAFYPLLSKANIARSADDQKHLTPLQVGMAGYTFLNFNVEQSIAMLQRVGVKYITLKDFHLPKDR